MAKFNLSWLNAAVIASTNALSQKALYRQKSVGGAWLETGFTPANPLPKYASSVQSPDVAPNKIWEFKTQCICTQGGPIDNDNGVQEQIAFACINPTLSSTLETATITLDLAGTDITKARFTLRKASDNSIAFGPYIGNRVGDVATALASGLTPGTQYYWQTVLFATVAGVEVNSTLVGQLAVPCGPYNTTTEAPLAQDLRWVADQVSCEKEGGFDLERTISGLSSPATAWYDSQTSRVYVADYDNNVKGNVYWFNPNTATAESDMTYSTQVMHDDLYNAKIDPEKRKIYFVGKDSNGLIVYDIDTDTVQTVAFGTNAAFSRITLTVTDNYIYCNDSTNSIVIINRHTLAIANTKTIASITNNAHFNTDVQIVVANNKAYVINVNNSSIGTIGVYSTDLNTHQTEIALPGAASWAGGFGNYWQNAYYDATSGNLYVGDIGSSSRHIINTTTDTVIDSRVMGNKSGKSNVQSFWTTNPITGELFYLYSALNSSADASHVKRTYLEDRTTHALTRMYENQAYSGLSHITGTTRLVGTSANAVKWNLNPSAGTDGTIQILNTAIGGSNTGRKIVLTLKEVDFNNANMPTGQTKINAQGDANYIAPAIDVSACAITYTTDCPVDQVTTFAGDTLEWEFSIASSVKNNPSIAKIQVYAYNLDTASTEGSPIEYTSPYDYHYFSGEFTGLTGSNYNIRIKYLDSSNAELQNC